jgi:hypothetical protein
MGGQGPAEPRGNHYVRSIRLSDARPAMAFGPVADSRTVLRIATTGRCPTDTLTVFEANCVRVAFALIRNETLEQSGRR